MTIPNFILILALAGSSSSSSAWSSSSSSRRRHRSPQQSSPWLRLQGGQAATDSSSSSSSSSKVAILEAEKSAAQKEDEMARAQRLMDFLDASPEPFHVTAVVAETLRAAGFVELSEKELWGASGRVVPGGKYFYVRNRSSLVAFTVGRNCLLYTSPSPQDRTRSRMPSSA